LHDLRIVEVTKLDMHIEDGKIVAYRTRVNVSFKYEPKEALDYRILAEMGNDLATRKNKL
jgi:hypothetical protein